MTLFSSACFLQKAGCSIFQKAGCPIFKNSGCRLTGRLKRYLVNNQILEYYFRNYFNPLCKVRQSEGEDNLLCVSSDYVLNYLFFFSLESFISHINYKAYLIHAFRSCPLLCPDLLGLVRLG